VATVDRSATSTNTIPNSEALGLDPEKIYYLLRDPLELTRLMDSPPNVTSQENLGACQGCTVPIGTFNAGGR